MSESQNREEAEEKIPEPVDLTVEDPSDRGGPAVSQQEQYRNAKGSEPGAEGSGEPGLLDDRGALPLPEATPRTVLEDEDTGTGSNSNQEQADQPPPD